MSGWNALAAGANYLGGALQRKEEQNREDAKLKMLQQLQREKEQRDYDRQLRKVANSKIEADGDGVYWKVDRNQEGTVLNKELAPKNEIDRINNENEKTKVSLESLLATANLKNKQAESYDEDQELKRENLQSQIERNRKTGDAALINANRPRGKQSDQEEDEPVGLGQASNELVKDYNSLVRSYTGRDGALTEEEVYQLASASIKAAGERGKDVGDTFAKALALQAAKNKANKKPASNGALTLGK